MAEPVSTDRDRRYRLAAAIDTLSAIEIEDLCVANPVAIGLLRTQLSRLLSACDYAEREA